MTSHINRATVLLAFAFVACGDSFSATSSSPELDAGDDGSRTYTSDASPHVQKFDAEAHEGASDANHDAEGGDDGGEGEVDSGPGGSAGSSYGGAHSRDSSTEGSAAGTSSGGASDGGASAGGNGGGGASSETGGATVSLDAGPECSPGHIAACSTCLGGWPPCCYQGACGCIYPLGCGRL